MIAIHDDYKANIYNWTLVRDVTAGEAAVKRKNVMYLPMPAGMENVKQAVSYINPNVISQFKDHPRTFEIYNPNSYPSNPAYQAYLHRAHLPGMAAHTLRGLVGIATRKHPSVRLPESMEYLFHKSTPAGWTLLTLYRECLVETLMTGRCGLLLDVRDDKFTFCRYKAEDILNWDYTEELSGVVLSELKSKGLFSDEYEEHVTILQKEDDRVYSYTYDSEQEAVTDDVELKMYGKSTNILPFRTIGALNNEPNVDPAPMLPVAQTALQIYMKNADLAQAEYLTCNPTLIISGVTTDEVPLSLGSTVAITLSDPLAKAYYTETDSAGMTHLLAHIERLSDEAATHGASLISTQKGEKESGDALRVRQAAATATLHSVVNNVGDAIESLLKQAAMWAGENPDDVVFQPNVEFSESGANAQELKSLVESYLNNTISLETLIDNFRRSGMLQPGDTVADEIDRLGSKKVDNLSYNSEYQTTDYQTNYSASDKQKLQDIPHLTAGKD